ncbi:MAG: M14 family metallopeptidase [Oscillospiraceae bacterium]|nr:M14 family metallopeptidase [Oscillospiraceae bacterium]
MMTNIVSVGLPINEALRVQKNRFLPTGVTDPAGLKRISVVTGIHGDELEGQYVCFELARLLNEHPEHLHGVVDIYPAMNPFGIDSITRGLPAFDLDMNRIFPGNNDGDMVEYIAAEIVKDISGSDLCFDIHASNIYLTEIPQIRINTLHEDWLLPLAELCNVDFIWVHGASTVLESTFAYSLNSTGTPTLVVEMGVGMRLTRDYCFQLLDGILNAMAHLGVWDGPTKPVRTPIISRDADDVAFLNAERAGVFIKDVEHGAHIRCGERLGRIVYPPEGRVLWEVTAPVDGWLFTIREYPVVESGSLVARILKNREGGR